MGMSHPQCSLSPGKLPADNPQLEMLAWQRAEPCAPTWERTEASRGVPRASR